MFASKHTDQTMTLQQSPQLAKEAETMQPSCTAEKECDKCTVDPELWVSGGHG